MLCGCSDTAPEAQVRADVESMRQIELDADLTAEITEMLSEEGKTDFETFIRKAGDFDFDITGSTEGAESTVVTVKVKTYCFGREYLRTWNDYLEKTGNGDFDQAEFYDLMMKNLSSAEDKTFTREIEINCSGPQDGDGDSTWTTDAKDNYQLRNAIMGGMLDEIAALVDISQ